MNPPFGVRRPCLRFDEGGHAAGKRAFPTHYVVHFLGIHFLKGI
jgi:hypothetical protein